MNKEELVDAIASKASIPKKTADTTLTATIEAIVEAVASGDKVSLVGFGSFAISATAIYAAYGWIGVAILGATFSGAGLLFWGLTLRSLKAPEQ